MSANSRKTGNLVALGSAAVVAVYGAGFMRTAAAAERFAQQSNEHVLSPAEAEVIAALANDPAMGALPAASSPASSATTTDGSAPTPNAAQELTAPNKVDATTAKGAAARAVVESVVAVPGASKTPGTSDVATRRNDVDAKKSSDSVSLPPSVVASSAPASTSAASAPPVTPAPSPAAAVPAAAAPAPAPPAPVKTDDAAPSADAKTAIKFKDGGYTGYGTSRHGDIEVYLETDGGKISYVKISQCLTQYSCSWISDLPGQVIARQAPRVDAPSGATQSASAFYYAVVQALSKAK